MYQNDILTKPYTAPDYATFVSTNVGRKRFEDDAQVWFEDYPEPTTDELAAQLRTERDARITSCDWIILRHRDELDEGDGTTLTAEAYAAWLAYRKALRDMPSADGFPWDGGAEGTPWPVEPVS